MTQPIVICSVTQLLILKMGSKKSSIIIMGAWQRRRTRIVTNKIRIINTSRISSRNIFSTLLLLSRNCNKTISEFHPNYSQMCNWQLPPTPERRCSRQGLGMGGGNPETWSTYRHPLAKEYAHKNCTWLSDLPDFYSQPNAKVWGTESQSKPEINTERLISW